MSTKGIDDGMSFNKELQKFNIPYYSLFKQLKKEIYMCYYVTEIWKGRKIPKQHLKENHTKGTRIVFGKCTWISSLAHCMRKKTLTKEFQLFKISLVHLAQSPQSSQMHTHTNVPHWQDNS